jgi:hypothetical protein
MEINDGRFMGRATGEAVDLLAKVLFERERTKRLLIGAACLFFVVAAVVVIFAPPAKQGLAYVLGAALVIMALGAIGVAQFKLKTPGVEVETEGVSSAGRAKSRKGTGRIKA